MSLATIVRNAVTLANTLTRPMQCVVTHTPWIGEDSYGAPVYGEPRTLTAIVGARVRQHKGLDDTIITETASVTLIGPIAANGASIRAVTSVRVMAIMVVCSL